ncbi:MAG: acyltransferase family protein [Bryobacteraceae bacterium]
MQRYAALDAYRGFIMVMLVANGFGVRALAQADPRFAWLAAQFDHVAWTGAVFWDMIQPAFLFMVGAAMPLALAQRQSPVGHVAWRALKLILLSQVLMCVSANRLHFQLINVLSQIGFTYFFCYLLLKLSFRAQIAGAALILAGHTALFLLFPGSEGAFSKTDNIGAVIDRAWLGRNYSGSYVTINFISSIASTLFGAWAARLVTGDRSPRQKCGILAGWAAGSFAAGLLLSLWIPDVKRLWTASFALYSTGWVLLMLLAFYWLFDVRGWKRLAFPLVVVGMNSIFIYSIHIVLQSWLNRSLGVFTGRFEWIGAAAPVAQATALTALMWSLCWWLYRRRVFLKL